ncbi:hypothetical protein JHK85_054038 [Glycine max]|nr:hypothetical protein JHK85_054038 [Glycine max]
MEAPCVIRGAQDSEVSSETLSVIGYLATVFMHTYREVNVCADPLAKMGSLSNRHFVALEVCPASLICKVAVDAAGTIFLGL